MSAPPEVLCIIFDLVEYEADFLSATAVNSAWRAAALGNPALWTWVEIVAADIHPGRALWIDALLRRSQNLGIQLSFIMDAVAASNSDVEAIARLFALTLPHLHRCTILTIYATSPIWSAIFEHAIPPSATLRFPRLRALLLRNSSVVPAWQHSARWSGPPEKRSAREAEMFTPQPSFVFPFAVDAANILASVFLCGIALPDIPLPHLRSVSVSSDLPHLVMDGYDSEGTNGQSLHPILLAKPEKRALSGICVPFIDRKKLLLPLLPLPTAVTSPVAHLELAGLYGTPRPDATKRAHIYNPSGFFAALDTSYISSLTLELWPGICLFRGFVDFLGFELHRGHPKFPRVTTLTMRKMPLLRLSSPGIRRIMLSCPLLEVLEIDDPLAVKYFWKTMASNPEWRPNLKRINEVDVERM